VEAEAEFLTAARRDPDVVVLEGLHALKHALRFGADVLRIAGPDPDAVLALAAAVAPDLDLRGRIERGGLGRRGHHTGVAAVARRPAPPAAGALPPGAVVLLEDPRHLGNVGAAVRVAAAAGAAALLTTGAADPWDPAALRGAAGLHFALPVGRGGPQGDRPLLALDPAGEDLGSRALPEHVTLAFGTERDGLGPELLARADARVRIPMRAGVSSLNLATAVAVALYSARSGFSQRSIVDAGVMPTDS
jgi:TrmH family RNA methyltransferase